MADNGLLPSFLGALQASLVVILTIGFGVVASRYNLLKEASSVDISKMCVRLFLPALLITNVGSQVHADTAERFVPALIWAIVYLALSIGIGWTLKRIFKFPAWTVPAIAFNNTTALPLLLVQSLDSAGILSSLLMSDDDTTEEAVARAKSYFLVASIVSNSMTFALGPKLLDDEESPNRDDKADDKKAAEQSRQNEIEQQEEDEENPRNDHGRTANEEEEHINETTTLLPDSVARREENAFTSISRPFSNGFHKLPNAIQNTLCFLYGMLNAPLIGAIIGLVLGLAPPLHRVFFSSPDDGGFFTAWLTAAFKNVGELFPALQLVVVGSKLTHSLLKMKRGEASGRVPWTPMLAVFFVRFILWPCISVPFIYLLATKTNVLPNDPVLYFVLMLMPTGPPATKLTALADVSGNDEEEKMSIAKFLTVSYAVSPVICFAVVGSLKASLAVGK